MFAFNRSMRRGGAALAVIGAAVAGCGAGGPPTIATAAPAAPAPACANTVDAELTSVARRIYGQEVHGRDVAGALARVERSSALASAVARGDAAATQAALKPLLRADIHRIVVKRGSRGLASFGSGPTLGPVHGTIREGGAAVGSFTLATGTDSGVASLIGQLTGARVIMGSGTR